MIKWILVVIAVIALIDYALLVACSRAGKREEYEAYERWKKEHVKEKDK